MLDRLMIYLSLAYLYFAECNLDIYCQLYIQNPSLSARYNFNPLLV